MAEKQEKQQSITDMSAKNTLVIIDSKKSSSGPRENRLRDKVISKNHHFSN